MIGVPLGYTLIFLLNLGKDEKSFLAYILVASVEKNTNYIV
jgi:hypothetical protein